ncbi:hypothetical protein [Candidatus Tokpelaia sp.]|nr:hypothetical protein [Candidatus Tokpelaia sp.]
MQYFLWRERSFCATYAVFAVYVLLFAGLCLSTLFMLFMLPPS